MGRKEQIDQTIEEDRAALGKKKNVGSSFDSFLEGEGIKDEVEAGAQAAVAELGTMGRCQRVWMDQRSLEEIQCEDDATSQAVEENGKVIDVCQMHAEQIAELYEKHPWVFKDAKTAFAEEEAAEDAAVAESKTMGCGHPTTAVVTSGRGDGATSYCAICEAEARAMSIPGVDCAVCDKEIEGSHYCCVNYGGEPVCPKCHEAMSNHVCVFQFDELPTEGLAYQYDQDTDVITIEGVKYAGEVFRTLSFAPIGTKLQIEGREGGTVTVRRIEDEG